MKNQDITHFGGRLRYPHEVARDSRLLPDEKRAILAQWASDANAVPSMPVLRHLPGTPFPVTFSSVMAAMAELDRASCANDDDPPPRPRAGNQQRADETQVAA
ncbi:MAG: hypothetical protein U1E93_13760 [Alphaproteobacteria bacterium]